MHVFRDFRYKILNFKYYLYKKYFTQNNQLFFNLKSMNVSTFIIFDLINP